MRAIWLAAVTATIPNKDEWGVTRILVGDYDARRRLQITARILEDGGGTVEVEVELTNTVTCASTDGCTDDESNAALASGNQVLTDVSASAASGELMTNIINESQGTDLVDTFTASTVDDVITTAPEIEIIDPTPFPTPTPPTSSPTASTCNDSSLKFEILNNGKILKVLLLFMNPNIESKKLCLELKKPWGMIDSYASQENSLKFMKPFMLERWSRFWRK